MEAPKLLKGEKALVTGVNSGIGRAVAVSLGKAGADVAVNYVAAKMWRKIASKQSTLPVNNADSGEAPPIQRMTLAQWNTIMSVNLAGQLLCSRQAIREFGRRSVAGT
jgi:glucose 1-dehydrogenase